MEYQFEERLPNGAWNYVDTSSAQDLAQHIAYHNAQGYTWRMREYAIGASLAGSKIISMQDAFSALEQTTMTQAETQSADTTLNMLEGFGTFLYCPACNKQFKRVGTWKNHMNAKHPEMAFIVGLNSDQSAALAQFLREGNNIADWNKAMEQAPMTECTAWFTGTQCQNKTECDACQIARTTLTAHEPIMSNARAIYNQCLADGASEVIAHSTVRVSLESHGMGAQDALNVADALRVEQSAAIEQEVTDVSIIHFVTYTMHTRMGDRQVTSKSDMHRADARVNDYEFALSAFALYCDTDSITLPYHCAELDTTIEQIDYIIPYVRMLPTV